MRILIAEDDEVLADGLSRSLRAAGYAVDVVSNGQTADSALAAQHFDVLILDLGLPGLAGLEVLRRLRARNSKIPVLILTAADSVEQRVKGLDVGADDYMAKPFALSELEARVRALTRRSLAGAQAVLRNGALALDPAGRVATLNDLPLELSARELGLLEILISRPGRLMRISSRPSSRADSSSGRSSIVATLPAGSSDSRPFRSTAWAPASERRVSARTRASSSDSANGLAM